METSHIKLESPGTYTILSGDALPQREPRAVDLQGIFTSPAEYVAKRGHCITPESCNVVFDYNKNSIILTVEEKAEKNTTVVGTLKVHPLLADLFINSPKSYSPKELHDKLRFQSRFFIDKQQHFTLMRKLLNFSVKVTQELDKMDDRKGNSLQSKAVQLQGRGDNDLNLDFTLKIEMIGGTEPVVINFTTELEVANGDPRIYLLSDDFTEKFESLKEHMFEEQLPNFAPYVIIIKK